MGLCVGAKVYCNGEGCVGYIIHSDGDPTVSWMVFYEGVYGGAYVLWRLPERLKFLGMVPQERVIQTARVMVKAPQDYTRDIYGVEDLSTIREIRRNHSW